eukprot:1178245-Pyramimonas_sp.AAC.1
MMRDREQWAISERESTFNSRSKQPRLSGGNIEGGGDGQRAFAMAATIQRLGLPTDKLASGRTKSETTCTFMRQAKNCPGAGQGCPYNHKKPKAPAAPAQLGASSDNRSVGRKSDRNGGKNRSASRMPKRKRPASLFNTIEQVRQFERDAIADEDPVGSFKRTTEQYGLLCMVT